MTRDSRQEPWTGLRRVSNVYKGTEGRSPQRAAKDRSKKFKEEQDKVRSQSQQVKHFRKEEAILMSRVAETASKKQTDKKWDG